MEYKGKKYQQWYYPGSLARMVVGRLKSSKHLAIQAILIPKGVDPSIPSEKLLDDETFIKSINEYAVRAHFSAKPHFDFVLGNRKNKQVIDFMIFGSGSGDDVRKGKITWPKSQKVSLLKFMPSHDVQYLIENTGDIPQGEFGAGHWKNIKRGKATLSRTGSYKHYVLTLDSTMFNLFPTKDAREGKYFIRKSTAHVKAMRMPSESFDKQYRAEARRKMKKAGIESFRKLPRIVYRTLHELAMKSPTEYVVGVDLEPSDRGTRVKKMVILRGQEYEADTDGVFDMEMMFHNHITSKDPSYVNFVPSPDDFMNVTINKPHVVSFKDTKTKRARFILLRSIREKTPSTTFFDKQLKDLARQINEEFNIHDDPAKFKRKYKQKLNELGFDFTYINPASTFIIYKNKM